MRVSIDRDRCIGAAQCAARAPAHFDLDDEQRAYLVTMRGGTEDVMLQAARSCPVRAIEFVSDDGTNRYPD